MAYSLAHILIIPVHSNVKTISCVQRLVIKILCVSLAYKERVIRIHSIIRSKCGKTPEILSIKRVRPVILAQKGTLIVARVRWQKQTRYVYIILSKCGKTPEMLCIKRVRPVIFAQKGTLIVTRVRWRK